MSMGVAACNGMADMAGFLGLVFIAGIETVELADQ
jgi:hypothetical protein